MRNAPHRTSIWFILPLAAALALTTATTGRAQVPALEELISAVVHIKTFINPDGRTLQNLGREREGSGIVIDGNGLVLTIGYLMVEAHAAQVTTNDGRTVPANVIGYDHETGFGLLQAIAPLKLKPLAIGKSADVKERDAVVVASFGGPDRAGRALVMAKREFAGNWEYMLDEAIFTTPPHPQWSGAALINREGKLVGVGSLIVGDATGNRDNVPGNMFVPIDRLPPILGDLIADGRASGPPRPWLGISTAGSAWASVRQPRDARQPGRKGRRSARRHHRRRQRRGAVVARRFLSQGLGRRRPPERRSRSTC